VAVSKQSDVRAARRSRARRLAALVASGTLAPRVVLQPVVTVRSARITGYEGLVRLDDEGQIGPDEVIAAAWSLGIGDEVEAACVAAVLERREELETDQFLAVNVSPTALGTTALERVLARHRLGGVVIELTEHAPMVEVEDLAEHLQVLRRRGALIAMDDAGAGYAGLAALLALRPQIVKLDRSLVAGIDRDGARSRLAQAFGTFLGELDAWLLAEGIETHGELAEVVRIGITLVQGYLLGRPCERPQHLEPDLERWLRDRSEADAVSPQDLRIGALASPAARIGSREEPVGHGQPWSVLQPVGTRPLAVLRHDAKGGVLGCWEDVIVVHDDDNVVGVCERLVLRDDVMLAPVVVVDGLGGAIGVAEPHRVLRLALAQLRSPSAGQGGG